MASKKEILVIGGNGKTGRRVVERLRKAGRAVRIGSRSSEIKFDWHDKNSWKPALGDIESVYITFQPDLAAPGAPGAIESLSAIAKESGVKKLVLLSGRGEEEAQKCEQIVMNSGADWTILRCSWFAQNFSESFFLEPILAGYVALPAGNIGEPFMI
jgi:uncharacterized protein YbjT (DUF2867 family)